MSVSVPSAAFGVVACHCDDCQRLHGNFFAMIAAPAADVLWTGEENLQWYESSPKARRAFCKHCGSRVAKAAVGSDRMLLSVGLFGPETGLHIQKQVFSESKPDWYALPSG